MMENQTVPVVTPQVVVEPKGNNFLVILLSILLFISLAIAGFFAFQTQKLVSELTLLKTQPTPMASTESIVVEPVATNNPVISDPTSDWKVFNNIKGGAVYKYPNNWMVINDMYISEKSFDPNSTERKVGVYNTISLIKYTTKFSNEKTNKQWFDDTMNGNEVVVDLGVKRTRLTVGNVSSGEPYFIVRNQAGTALDQIRAYSVKDESIYEFILSDYDEKGLNIFKNIIKTVSLN